MGHDGRTAFERLSGKSSRGDGYEFGEQVHYRVRPGDMDQRLNLRRGPGRWLGPRWGAREESCGAPPARRALAPRGSAMPGVGPRGAAGRVCACGRRPGT
eukprot:13192514-Alexandrium_andersonii.AAC.1